MELTAAAALLYSSDPKWQEYKATHPFDEILADYCGITDASQANRILENVKFLQSGEFAALREGA